MAKTLYDKIWESHLVHQQSDGTSLIYVDRHLVHEVTSPQAFEGLRIQKRNVRRPELTLAVPDHNVPTTDRSKGINDQESKIQVDTPHLCWLLARERVARHLFSRVLVAIFR